MASAEDDAGDDRHEAVGAATCFRLMRIPALPAVPLLAALLLLPACMPPDPPGGTIAASSTAPPRYATYRCDGDGEITLENFRTSVHVVDTRGIDVELPAAPPDQSTRYGQPGYALVLENGTALWMVTGKRPINCKREIDPA
jgi:hypothetical protein